MNTAVAIQENSVQETPEQEIDRLILEVIKHLDGMKSHILQAGKIYVQLLKKDPKVKEKFKAFNISYAVLSFLERVGRETILPEFLYTPFQNCKLPISEQQRIANGKVELLVLLPDGREDIILTNLLDAPSSVLKQVIPDGRILSVVEQKHHLIAETNKKTLGTPKESHWKIIGNALIVNPSNDAIKITKKELKQILSNME